MPSFNAFCLTSFLEGKVNRLVILNFLHSIYFKIELLMFLAFIMCMHIGFECVCLIDGTHAATCVPYVVNRDPKSVITTDKHL